jgi:hypothetical protein
MLDPRGSIASRYTDSLYERLGRAAAELINDPTPPSGTGQVLALQRLALLAYDAECFLAEKDSSVGREAVAFARRCRQDFLGGTRGPCRLPLSAQ